MVLIRFYSLLQLVLSLLWCSLGSILCWTWRCLSCGAHQALLCSAARVVFSVVLFILCSVLKPFVSLPCASYTLLCAMPGAAYPMVLLILFSLLQLVLSVLWCSLFSIIL